MAIKDAKESLYGAADSWDDVKDVLTEGKKMIASVQLPEAQMRWFSTLRDNYINVPPHVEELLKDGVDSAEGMSIALRNAYNSYQREEESGRHAFEGLY
ncbi:hypothetical protein [Nocardia sp. NPDC057668]|uniref:hypothetical protein n=1 Tax=Nocardia sp. NPDC057668 TaxID=3346202 RepID=UPI00366BE155